MQPDIILAESIQANALLGNVTAGNLPYHPIIERHSLPYKTCGCRLEVGNIMPGPWILDISVIAAQFTDLLEEVIPLLTRAQVPFSIPTDDFVLMRHYSAEFGYEQLGRIVCIYPHSAQQATEIAKKLVEMTQCIRGASIPSDAYLGGAVYARLSEYNTVPFALPKGVDWPFHPLKKPMTYKRNPLGNGHYVGLEIIKSDVKGDVIKAIDFDNWWKMRFRMALGKQGKRDMSFDQVGRTIQDRLFWQYQVQNELKELVPVPEPYECYVDPQTGNTYLWMEWIEGKQLQNVREGYAQNRVWWSIPTDIQEIFWTWLRDIIRMVGCLHDHGFIHRDLTPVNFLVEKTGRLRLVDLELTFSEKNFHGKPPFTYGSDGFMSPEQAQAALPTVKEDIYSLGALMLTLLVGLHPKRIQRDHRSAFSEKIDFFLHDLPISELIAKCLETDPDKRPTLNTIQKIIFNRKVTAFQRPIAQKDGSDEVAMSLPEIITQHLATYKSGSLASPEGLWISTDPTKIRHTANATNDQAILPGWNNGIAGVQYVLALLKMNGYDMDTVKDEIRAGWGWLQHEYLNRSERRVPGLYYGSYGHAVSLATGIRSGLLIDNAETRNYLHHQLSPHPNDLTLGRGVAGLGLSVLYCLPELDREFAHQSLDQCVQTLLKTQQKDGSWYFLKEGSRKAKRQYTGLSYGIAGAVYFLLEYYRYSQDPAAKKAAQAGLTWLTKLAITEDEKRQWPYHPNSSLTDHWMSLGNGGIILTYLKAYDYIKEEEYKKLAIGGLMAIPPYLLAEDMSLATGLTGIGNLYLQANKIIPSTEWEKRATHIAEVLYHSSDINSESNTLSWHTNHTGSKSADFLTGNAGIAFFLSRYLNHFSNTETLIF